MAMGKRRPRPKQTSMWVATQDLPRGAAHPLYARLNQILDQANFDGYIEALCQRFYADEIGRPGLPPGRYFRLAASGSCGNAASGWNVRALTSTNQVGCAVCT